MVVTIDGPAGSGKSTVARILAKKLSFIHLNSGLLFRAVASEVVSRGIDLADEERVVEVAKELDFSFSLRDDSSTVFLVDGQVREDELRSPSMGNAASHIAVLPLLRQFLLEVQRDLASKYSLVVEGRDSGSVVFPDAEHKFFLDASPSVRAVRRHKELSESDSDESNIPSVQQIEAEIRERDSRDTTREVAPNIKSDDAELIDTSELSIDEVVELIAGKLA